LIQAADLGLVYTTTVGLEMAMSGLPVIVVGQTHYRGKGFSIDPENWEDYSNRLSGALKDIGSVELNEEKVDLASIIGVEDFPGDNFENLAKRMARK